MKLFKNPKIGDKVTLKTNIDESEQRIVEVTEKSIRVSSCNLCRFNRSGKLNKSDSRNGDLKWTIRPVDNES
ncbi:MAG: hypothetical protein ACXVH2_00785 [Methanobacterium sp.]